MVGNLDSILFVDDDSEIRMLLRLSLQTAGFKNLHECETGEEALEMVRAMNPSLILLDRVLPGMNGDETLQALRNDPTTAHVPVIFVSGKKDSGDVTIGNGVLGVIKKPFNPMSLGAEVKELWTKAGGLLP